MKRSYLIYGLAIGTLAIGACSSEVLWDKGGSTSAPGEVDQECYDACIAKGASPEECAFYCSDPKGTTGKTPGSTSNPGTGTSSGGTVGTGGAGAGTGTGGKLDPEVEKPCVQCWYDESQMTGVCVDEAKACEQSLACSQLQWCPMLCGKPDCIQECNEIIPSGVAPLSALVQCMACEDGPCAEECQDSVMLSYCK